MIPVAVVETRYEGHQSMSEVEGNWGGCGGVGTGVSREHMAFVRTGDWLRGVGGREWRGGG